MNIISRTEAGLVPPSAPLTHMTYPDGIVCHWVGSGGLSAAPTRNETLQVWRQIQAESMAGIRGQVYIDIPYSFGVDPMGLILEGRGFDNQSAANGTSGYNAHAYAICHLAGPGIPFTSAAKAAFLDISQEIAKRHAAISYCKPHSAVYATQCPGPELLAYCPIIQARLHAEPPPTFKVRPEWYPPMQFTDIVDDLSIQDATGGAWLLKLDGTVFAMGRGETPVIGGPHGHSYWVDSSTGKDRIAAKLVRYGEGYSVISTDGARYDFPHK